MTKENTHDQCDKLVTVARVTTVFMGIETFAGDLIRGRLKSGDTLVTRQNAEAVIGNLKNDVAAKDKLIQSLIDFDSEEVKRLEADNKRLREALKDLIERFSYYADLARDGVPNIEDWAYTEGSSDIAKAHEALEEAKRR